MPTIDELRERIARACDEAQRRGLTIINDSWGIEFCDSVPMPVNNCCCPMGALMIAENIGGQVGYDFEGDEKCKLVGEHLGVSAKWVEDFISGVDRLCPNEPHKNAEAYDLGAEFRARYVTP